MKRRLILSLIIVALALVFAAMLYACTPYIEATVDRYPVNHDTDDNLDKQYPDHSAERKKAVVDRATGAMDNLLRHLNTEETSDTGYYSGADIVINTFDIIPEERSAFRLKLRANLYTYPYEIKDAEGNVIYGEDGKPLVDEQALAIHNQLIKYNDIVLEWYDGMNNKMLLGFYFDGINPNSADPGNHLYLNLLGSKRIFLDFGDSVLYQQIVRLITKFDMNTILGGDSSNDESALKDFNELLQKAVTTNYKEVINGDVTSLYFYNIDLGTESAGVATDTITEYMQNIFSPFEDKLDPLTFKYLGFKFSTLGDAEITRLIASLQYFVSTPRTDLGEILTGMVIDLDGDARVQKKRGAETVPFTSRISFTYSLRISTDIVIDKQDYTVYEYGNYEYVGDLFIPYLDLELDALIRTDINENDPSKGLDNSTNRIFAQFYDKSNNDVIIGLYYKDEISYIDITNLQHLYGGIDFEDLGLPKAYKEGFNLGLLMTTVFDLIDEYIVLMVDDLLAPSDGSSYDALTEAIMANIESTMKDPDIPSSRNTIRLRIDMDLIKIVLRETSENGTEYTNKQLINLIDEMFGIELESIAAIMGMNVETLMETTYIDITYDVDEYSICIEVFSNQNNPEGDLVLKLDLRPTHIGEAVKISFPQFDNFKPLQEVMTYSGYMEGQIIFAATEEVDLSDLMGSFIGDLSGKNTPYILPEAADIYFTMYYDQYIRDQILANGRWTRAGRSAFNLQFYVFQNNTRVDLFRVYGNDVSFDTSDPVEELGYVWVDLVCVEGMPHMKVREDLFIETFAQYMRKNVTDDEGITVGLTTIIQALLEDSWPVFEPEVIRITTSNQTFKDMFRVDELIATISLKIGFKQRVFNIDELEADFAMYTVGEFTNIAGGSPYEITLHDTIKVYFDFGNYTVEKDFLFNYKPESIAVTNNTDYYYPTIDGLFMGVTRSYQVRITGGNRGRSKINRLVDGDSVWVWEPLRGGFPTKAAAYYGETLHQQYDYDADYRFYAYYDRDLDYYIVPNDLGYEILYDHKKDAYIVGLGTNYKIDKVYEILDKDNDVILLKNYTDYYDIEYEYDIGAGLYGYYVVKTNRCNMLYNAPGDFYVIQSEADLTDARIVVGKEAVIYIMTSEIGGRAAYFDLNSGCYIIDDSVYEILYDNNNDTYYVRYNADLEAVKVLLGVTNVAVATSVQIDWDRVDYSHTRWNSVDWQNEKYKNIVWGEANWENITLEGGLFIVEVVIGKGKMATYRELIDVKVLNRTVDTDKYVNINLFDEETQESYKVKAPVADYIEIDPYVYILLRADYENNLKEAGAGNLGADFVEWLFKKYLINIPFTDIYHNGDDTPDENGYFNWAFDYPDENSTYREQNINNRVQENDTERTYVYTNFMGQIIALGINILPRTIDYIMFEGETEINTYTVDALIEATYTIPKYPVIYFRESDENGNALTLDFADYGAARSTIFRNAPAQISNNDISVNSVPSGMTKRGSIINWSNPVAENVKLINEISPDTGTVLPFFRSNTNITTSFIDIRNFVDPVGVWFVQSWFATPIISVAVEIPDKVVDTFSTEIDGVTYTYSDVAVQQGAENGRYYADPYNTATWEIPSNIEVRFRNEDGTYYVKRYDVEWNTGEHLEYVNGKYILKNITKTLNYFTLTTRIGNPQVNYIDISLLVCNRSGIVSRVEYLGADGSVLAGSLINDPDYIYDEFTNTYAYEVDTYSRFEIPKKLRILFDDGTVRTYNSNWEPNPPWAPGAVITIRSAIGTVVQELIPLTFLIEEREIQNITFNMHTAAETIDYDIGAKTIDVYGAVFNGGMIDNRTPYEYFMHLFSSIEVAFTSPGKFGSPVTITDAAESVVDIIIKTFDTQKVISPAGQTFTIQLGQGPLADDYSVNFKASGMERIVSGTYDNVLIEPFNVNTNQANYGPDNPYLLSAEICLEIYYESAGRFVFGTVPKDNATRPPETRVNPSEVIPLINDWYVMRPQVMPAGYNEGDLSTNMIGLTEGQKITEISWNTLLGGGYVWITTMLPDSSRVYRRLEVVYIDIGFNYNSAPGDPSPFKIVNGRITINDIYSVYPLSSTLTAATLPKSIVTGSGSGVIIPIHNWEILVNTDFLSYINYQGQAEFLLARANVVGETIELRMVVRPAVIRYINYTDSNASKSFESVNNVIYFDAYVNYGYQGIFTLPKTLRLYFDTGYYHDNANTVYYSLNDLGDYNQIIQIRYTIEGHNLGGIADISKVKMRIILADNQIYNFEIRFYNKTIEHILMHSYNGAQYPGKLYIDPYGTRGLPLAAEIKFAEGPNMLIDPNNSNYVNYMFTWVYPENYEVKYDTYKRILEGLPDNAFKLSAPLVYPGLTTQTVYLDVIIIDRVMTEWETIDGKYDYLSGNSRNPNADFHYPNPFTGRASDLPEDLVSATVGNVGSIDIKSLPIKWYFSDSEISAEGTVVMDSYGKYGKIVKGYLRRPSDINNANITEEQEYGQQITIRIYMNRWTLTAVLKPQGEGYQIMSDIRFIFSRITGASSYSSYQMRFQVVDPSSGVLVNSVKNEIFIPEDVEPEEEGYPYRIRWDSNAKTLAKTFEEAQGVFVLINAARRDIITPNITAYYQYERVNISQLDLGYGYGENNYAIYVVNPLDPVFTPTGRAKGTLNMDSNADLGEVDIQWSITVFSDVYLKGGVFMGYDVTVKLKWQNFDHTPQHFNIMLVFLDMSPTGNCEIVSGMGADIPHTLTSTVKTEYSLTTYQGAVINPYRDIYSQTLVDALNDAVTNLGLDQGDNNVVFYDNIVWERPDDQIPTTVTRDTTFYSLYVTIGNKTYTSNIIKLIIKAAP